MRAVGKKGVGDGTEMGWLIQDIHEEIASWGHPGGITGEIVLKSDGGPGMVALRDAVA